MAIGNLLKLWFLTFHEAIFRSNHAPLITLISLFRYFTISPALLNAMGYYGGVWPNLGQSDVYTL